MTRIISIEYHRSRLQLIITRHAFYVENRPTQSRKHTLIIKIDYLKYFQLVERFMDDVRYEVSSGYATITLDRPDVYNAFTQTTIDELNEAIHNAREDDNVYALVLTGNGDGFCSGADVSSMPDWSDLSEEDYGAYLWKVQTVVHQLRSMSKPTIAAVNGPAIGAGCDFALACDIRYMHDDAILREGFVRIGLIPGDGGAWLLPRLIGEAKAREYLLTGRDIAAGDAADLGLAIQTAEDPLVPARNFAEEIRGLPARAVQRTKDLIDSQQTFEEYRQHSIEYQWECVNDKEHLEAVEAFRENREPDYDRD